jgi:hypothetical protein
VEERKGSRGPNLDFGDDLNIVPSLHINYPDKILFIFNLITNIIYVMGLYLLNAEFIL